jgi:hypothetical protein
VHLAQVHRWVGLLTLGVFVTSGVFLKLRLPDLAAHNDSIRWLFRANHIYLLMAGLLNLAAVHAPSVTRWRARAQGIGSALLLLAPVVLVAAFIREPGTPEPGRPLTHAGIIALAAGTVLRAGLRRPRTP